MQLNYAVDGEAFRNGDEYNIDTTLIRILADNAKRHPDETAIREKDMGIWQKYSWTYYLTNVLEFAAGLESLGFGKEDAALVLGDNRPRLYISMVSLGAIEGYALPVYPDAAPDEVLYFAQEANVRFAIAEDQEQVDKLLDLRVKIGTIQHIIYNDSRGMGFYDEPGLISFDDVLALGRKRLEENPELANDIVRRSQPTGPAVFVHSSGTTGRPKGVVLKNRNLLAGVRNTARGNGFGEREEILAYLPMAWIGDFAVSVAAGISMRFILNIPERQETVLHNLREIAPTFYLAAPRSWDNMLTTIQVRMEDSTRLKKWIFDYFMKLSVGAERRKLGGQAPTFWQKALHPLGEALVYAPIKDHLGMSRVRSAVTGGEAMGEDTFLFYRALGIKLRQLYGQTESSAFNAIQQPDEVRLHTVGRPLPSVEVKINDTGEILVRSESVFDGYFDNEEATRNTLEDGWLHTGDAGYLEEDGHLVVLGRVSEVVYTSANERYIPNYIENRIKFSPYCKDVAVIGSGREHLTAIVCVDFDAVGHWAELRGISYISYADLSQKPEVYETVASAIRHVNKTLPDGLKIRRFVNLHKEFDPDDGEITRTRKLRRNVVEERYLPIIEALYSGQDSVVMKAQLTYETGETGTIERALSVREV